MVLASLLSAPDATPPQWAYHESLRWREESWRRYALGRSVPLAVVAGGLAWWRLRPGVLWAPVGRYMPVWRGTYDLVAAAPSQDGGWDWSLYRGGVQVSSGSRPTLPSVLEAAVRASLR